MTGSTQPPPDRRRIVYALFYFVGIGTLLPWNFFLAVNSYWMYKFRDVTNSSAVAMDGNDTQPMTNVTRLSDLQLSWGPNLSMSAMIPNVTVLLLNALFGHKIKITPRLFASMVVIILIFILSDVMTKVNTDDWQHGFMGLTLFTVVVFNIMVAVFQGGLMGIIGKFPPAYMGAVIQGQALGGIIAVTVNLIMLATGLDAVGAAFCDFLIATIYLVASLGALLYIFSTDFYKFYAHEGIAELRAETSVAEEKSPEADQLLEGGGSDAGSDKKNTSGGVPPERCANKTWVIAKTVWIWIAAVFVTFFTTLAVFPSITQLVFSTHYDQDTAWSRIYFVPVGCFLVFNLGDYFGRLLFSWLQWPGPTKRGSLIVLAISIVRLSFIPLFLFCNITPHNRVVTSVVFESDTAYLIFMVIFSLSNGYLGNVVMTFGPKVFSSPEEQGQAASILVFFLVFGLAIGSAVSQLCVKLL